MGNLSWERLIEVERLPAPNEDAFIKRTKIIPGGAAANVACTLGLLGNNVGLLAAVGRDRKGEELAQDVKNYNVNTDTLLRIDRETSEFIVVLDSLGNRSFFLNLNEAAFNLSADGVVQSLSSKQGSSLAFVGCRLGLAEEAVSRLQLGGTMLFANIGFWIAAGALTQASLDFLARFSCLFLNRSEYEMLDASLKEEIVAIPFLRELGKQLVITDGANPTVVVSSKGYIEIESGRLEEVVNTLGCGDAFMGGYLSNFIKNNNPEECCRLGHSCAKRIARLEYERSENILDYPLFP